MAIDRVTEFNFCFFPTRNKQPINNIQYSRWSKVLNEKKLLFLLGPNYYTQLPIFANLEKHT